jgi:hypothetical protein
MSDKEFSQDKEEIFSKALRAGRRTYFFDVRATKSDDYYLTITESKKFTNEDGSFRYKKHKIYLYKEDFEGFKEFLNEATDYVIENRGEEVISETHQTDFDVKTNGYSNEESVESSEIVEEKAESFTDVEFEDL